CGQRRDRKLGANSSSRPVKAAIDNIYLLAIPSSKNKFDPEDDERRKQATQMEKLENSELLLSSTAGTPGNMSIEEAEKNELFVAAVTNNILDNHQLRIKNVHVCYEDKISVPGHPFLIGLTLAELSAVSTGENFGTSSIVGSNAGIHKSTSLDSLATRYHAQALWSFAIAATKHEVHQRAYKCTWDCFRKLSISDDRSVHDIISWVFDGFSADALQQTNNMELGLVLVGVRVSDGPIRKS
ncbi:hypothetical protein O181_113501, partial [Austropuccinia psidii MF-1]|nr:hypothetical protein [Austropuccinia psidii MF-1]